MGKLKHFYESGVVYFITSITKDRRQLFFDRLACQFLIACLGYHKYIYSYKIYGFVIMPDHFHCLIQPASEAGISKILQHIKGNFARKYNLIRKRRAYLWQEGFYDEGLRGSRQLSNMINYMHHNPVRAGLVALPEHYEFSSYQYYHGSRYRDLVDDL